MAKRELFLARSKREIDLLFDRSPVLDIREKI